MQVLAVVPRGAALPTMSGILLGQVISASIFGITTIQAILYYSRFRRDFILNHVVVVILWLLQALNVCGQTVGLYHFFVALLNPMEAIELSTRCGAAAQVAEIFMAGITQACLGNTIYRLSRQLITFTILLLLILVETVLGTIFVLMNTARIPNPALTRNTLIAWAVLSGFIDAVLASFLMYHLQRRKSGRSSSDNIIRVMAIYAMSNGVVTVVLSITLLITVMLNQPFAIAFIGIAYAGFYNMGFFANLHSRRGLQSDEANSDPGLKSLQDALGMKILVTQEIRRTSCHEGRKEYEMKRRLDAKICGDECRVYEDDPAFEV